MFPPSLSRTPPPYFSCHPDPSPLLQLLEYKEHCSELEASLQSQEEEVREEELVATIRNLEERAIELRREHQEERERHQEELRTAVDNVEEHQHRLVG